MKNETPPPTADQVTKGTGEAPGPISDQNIDSLVKNFKKVRITDSGELVEVNNEMDISSPHWIVLAEEELMLQGNPQAFATKYTLCTEEKLLNAIIEVRPKSHIGNVTSNAIELIKKRESVKEFFFDHDSLIWSENDMPRNHDNLKE